MSRGKREEISEKKINKKKVLLVIAIILIIIAGIIIVINKDRILNALNKEEQNYSFEDKIEPEENEKTIDDIVAEFGGEVIERPKSDTCIVSKDGKNYTVYSDGEILEEVSFWNGQSSKPPIDEVGNINIYSAEEFKWVADQVINGEENFSGVTITLRKNLDFGARIKEDGTWEGPVWTSIVGFLDELPSDKKETEEKTASNEIKNEEITDAEKENLKRFAGCLNGNGFSIRGIYVDSDKNYQGLFGYSVGTIENVKLINSYISGKQGTGAIVGLNGGVVKNCSTKGTIVNGKDSKVGGIAGISMSNSMILQSKTEQGKVLGNKYVAGIAGYVNNNVTITECSNSAEIKGEDSVGGIAGIAFYGTSIQNSSNNGKINGKNNTGGITGYSQAQLENVYNTEEITGENFVAGLVGVNFTMGDILASYNTGNVSGNNNIGGIVGTNNASTSSCYNTGYIKGAGYRVGGVCGQNASESFINNSYNIGKIEGNENIGGIVGGDFGSITNCYYLNSVLENIESDQSKTEEELKNSLFEDLGESFVADEKSINNGYPILNWQIE